MALRLLGGPPIDIHAGGIDLIFPHHENEIAQAEGATEAAVLALLGARRASVRREREDVEVARQRLRAARHRSRAAIGASALRYLLLSSHYRKQLNFTWAGMDQAEESLRRIVDFLARLDDRRRATSGIPTIDAAGRRRRATRSRRRSRTISIPRRRWRRSSIWSATSTPRSTRKQVSAADAALVRDGDRASSTACSA